MNKIDRLLQTSDFERAHELVASALEQFPGDQELLTLERLTQEGRERSTHATTLMQEAEAMIASQHFTEAIEILRKALTLDPNGARVRSALADALAGEAQTVLKKDWRAAELLIQEALHLAPAHALAKSLRPTVLLAKRTESIDNGSPKPANSRPPAM